jgi:hypothetical protein
MVCDDVGLRVGFDSGTGRRKVYLLNDHYDFGVLEMRFLFAAVLGFNIGTGVVLANEEPTLKAKVEQATESGSEANSIGSSGSGFTDTVCTSGGNIRKVELISASTEAKVPCEVHYKKETEQVGHDEILWSANNDLGYCHAKAAAFVDKLTGMGWSCTAK